VPKTFDVELDEDQLLQQEQHLDQGGLFVPAGSETPEALTEVKVRLKTPSGEAEVDAQVVQVIPGGGVGLVVNRDHAEKRIRPLLARAKRGGDSPKTNNVALQMQRLSTEEKIEKAKHGDRAERLAMMKDTNKVMHLYILQNEGITPEELRHMASLRSLNPAALQKIAQNKVWMRDKLLVNALVCNPKTPPDVARRALEKLGFMELRKLVKMSDVPPQIIMAARRRMMRMKY
jgi:hypothetical protein